MKICDLFESELPELTAFDARRVLARARRIFRQQASKVIERHRPKTVSVQYTVLGKHAYFGFDRAGHGLDLHALHTDPSTLDQFKPDTLDAQVNEMFGKILADPDFPTIAFRSPRNRFLSMKTMEYEDLPKYFTRDEIAKLIYDELE